STVGLIFDNRFKLVVSILTCIRFGIIFTIIGKDNPLNKSIYQIKDSNSNYIITDKKLEEDLISAVSEVINYDEAIKYNKKQEQLQNMNLEDIACICYTSGTTGDSKGIPIIYGAITNASISHSKIRSWEYNKQLTSAVSAKETFIVFLYTLLTYIYMGSTIYITNNEETTNYSSFLDFLIKNKIDDTFFPPTMVDYYLNNVNNPFLKNIFTGGDKVKLTKLNDSVNVSVIYGLTETFAGSTSYKIDSLDKSLCIGKPFLNTQLFVLDNEYNQCDNNQIGQIALSGIQNSNFYINNDEETKKHFIDNPYSSKYTIYNSYYDKIFLTGDYGYIGDDGNLYFASRKDNQVQIRGKRVEINEITTVLDQIKEVSKSYVLAKQDNDDETYLTCFYVSDTLSESGLRDILNDELVDYMVPSFIVKLDEMPLNVHHKIDVKKLEQIEY
ncbi:MAG: AMP-binding protein, partial [Methanobrevibacter sp.]|nr:AMP-binding protein [Methanobrevibacter sp.]